MNSHFRNRFCFIILFLFALNTTFVLAQDENESPSKNEEVKDNSKLKQQKLGFLSFDAFMPIPTGDNFAGKGLQGKTSYNFKAQLFVYKQFFIVGAVGDTYLKTKESTVTGNYSKTTVVNDYLALGYELILTDKTRLGASIGVVGTSIYKNTIFFENNEAYQKDYGKVNIFDVYFDYQLSDSFALYFNYSYRNDKMEIKAPSEIQSFFDKAQFHNIGLGIKLYIGEKDLFSLIME